MDDRERLLDLVEGLRAEMNSKLDALVLALNENAERSPPPPKRRAALRPPYKGTITPTDIDREKARAALRRMGLG